MMIENCTPSLYDVVHVFVIRYGMSVVFNCELAGNLTCCAIFACCCCKFVRGRCTATTVIVNVTAIQLHGFWKNNFYSFHFPHYSLHEASVGTVYSFFHFIKNKFIWKYCSTTTFRRARVAFCKSNKSATWKCWWICLINIINLRVF